MRQTTCALVDGLPHSERLSVRDTASYILLLSLVVLGMMLVFIILPSWVARRQQSSPRVAPTARMLAYAPSCRASAIYRNNGAIAGAISAGVLTGGLLSAALVFSVGLGAGAQIARIAPKVPLWFLVLAHFPHGVLELPALALAAGAGLSSLLLLMARRPSVATLVAVCAAFVVVSQGMLLVSAYVECKVTPWVVRSWATSTGH